MQCFTVQSRIASCTQTGSREAEDLEVWLGMGVRVPWRIARIAKEFWEGPQVL